MNGRRQETTGNHGQRQGATGNDEERRETRFQSSPLAPSRSPFTRRFLSSPVWLILTLLTALALRVYGLRWGLPDARHLFSYHPDEISIIAAAARMDITVGQLNPHFFNYGTLYIYLVYAGSALFGWLLPASAPNAALANFHLIARLITVLLGTGTVYITYCIGRTLYGVPGGLIAAALLAVMPGHVVHSHYATVDVPATFFIALSLLYIAKALPQRLSRFTFRAPLNSQPAARSPQPVRCYALAGLFAGFAAATKYNAGLVLLCAFVPALARALEARRRARAEEDARSRLEEAGITEEGSGFGVQGSPLIPQPAPLTAVLMSIVGFFIGCPYALLAPQEFLGDPNQQQGVLYELLVHPRIGSGSIFKETGAGWWYHLATNMPVAMSQPILTVALMGVLWGLWRRSGRDLLLLAFIVPYFLAIGLSQVRFLRYTIVLLPFFALAAAGWIEQWRFRRFDSQRDRQVERLRQWLARLLIACALLMSIANVSVFGKVDPRDAAADWVEKNVPEGAAIGLLTPPWFYTPPVIPTNGGPQFRNQFEQARQAARYRFILTEGWDAEKLQSERPGYFLLSEFEYREEKRLNVAAAREFIEVLERDYERAQTFKTEPRLLFWRAAPQFPPHDWLYPFPEVRIYQRKG